MSKTLYAIFPHAKILLITRGYSTVFDSVYAQYISMGGIQSCEDFMSINQKMLSTFYDYNYSIDLYRRTFGKENVVVLPFELLKDNPQEFQRLIEQQLSIRQKFDFPAEKGNASMDRNNLNAYYHASRLVYNLLQPFPESLQTKLYLKYCAVIRAKVPHPALQFVSRFLKKTIQLDGTGRIVSLMKGKAEIFRDEELYQPYLSQYLID
jgi:hypothetical protein